MAVASTSVALSGLTITPSVPPDAVSGDWTYGGMGGGRFSPFAASARASRSRGGGSISSVLTEAPSLASFSPFTGGGVGGGFGGGGGTGSAGASWRPSTDRHACGESRRIPLIFVRNDREEFCLGCIGDDEYRFCRSTVCNIVTHKKRPYDLGCQEGYYIPTVFAKASRATQAFRTPFLDASKLTPEVRVVIISTRDQGLKTTIETPLWKPLGGRDKGRGSAKDHTRMTPPAIPWSLFSTSLVSTSSLTVRFSEILTSDPVMKLNLPCW